jgi:hypothetical protein
MGARSRRGGFSFSSSSDLKVGFFSVVPCSVFLVLCFLVFSFLFFLVLSFSSLTTGTSKGLLLVQPLSQRHLFSLGSTFLRKITCAVLYGRLLMLLWLVGGYCLACEWLFKVAVV